jgi:tetratricopeptide (TPR) repeat protein
MAVVGETPNIAARVEALAQVNTIVVSASTHALVGAFFDFEDLGAHALKGVRLPVPLYRVIDERAPDRHGTDGVVPVQPLVGREEEIGLLRRAWQSIKDDGRGKVVTISGEAGIGKSALIDSLRADVRAEGLPRIILRCSPYHTNSALNPVIEYYRGFAGWLPDDDVATRLDKLEAALAPFDLSLAETVPLLASLLGLALPEERYPPSSLTPLQQKQQTQDVIIAMILEQAERQPLLALWEDLHWTDPSTLELIGLLIEQAPTASLLIVLSARSEFVPPWATRSHVTPITLNRLEHVHAKALVKRIAGAKSLPIEVSDHIVGKTDGVPLYVEELTKTILASEILRDAGDRFELTGPLSSLAIPDTLQDSLMARLDSVPEIRELAQLGSVLGREFDHDMISGLSQMPEAALSEGLGRLVDAELLYQRGRPPRAKYIFKHALIRDSAYQSLLKRARQQVHRRAAELLEEHFPEIVDTNPEVIAHHFSEADDIGKAVNYWQRAGQQASARFAHHETISHYRNVVALLSTLDPSPERAGEVAGAQIAIGGALLWTAGPGAPEVGKAFDAAIDLCETVDDDRLLARSLLGAMGYNKMRGNWSQAETLARRLLAIAEKTGKSADLLPARVSLIECFCWQGRLREAQEQIDRAVSLEREILADPAKTRTSPWSRVATYIYAAMSLMSQGLADQAMAACETAVQRAEKLAHPYSRVFALYFATHFAFIARRFEETLALSNETIELAAEHQFSAHVSGSHIYRGLAIANMSVDDNVIDEIRDGIAGWQRSGGETGLAIYQAEFAVILARRGRADEAWTLILEARDRMENSEERVYRSDGLRLLGEIALLQASEQRRGEAVQHFTLAIEAARSQDARLPELRACVQLATVLHQQGETSRARHVLVPVYNGLPKDFVTADLKDAKALLEELK